MAMPSRQRRLPNVGVGGRLLAFLTGLLFFSLSHADPLLDRLEAALPIYRQLAGDPAMQAAWNEALPSFGSRKLEPGKPYAGLALLIRRLAILGDLPADAEVPPRYEGKVVDGIVAFQRHHGLEPDGVIGKDTLAQLNIAPARRVRQIELNIERLKQLPHAPRRLLVNVPEFLLRAFEQDEEKLRMRIIVGSALKTRTTLFVADMRFIEFSPYWNVPPSIARQETIPKLRSDPAYFAEQGFEFYSRAAGADTTLSDENLEAVLEGKLRIRQRPGVKNALGGIKFAFPNHDNIYLHHTPAVRLFNKARRDFSHGCIRVEEPLVLAKFVLANQPDWDEARIRTAMSRGVSATLRLHEPLPVVIAYLTAMPGDDGRVRFFPDLYNFDALQ
jgi:murein L,D-transpeptidase YcbB/YkuD